MARILGIDFGERRMGLAVSDPDGILAVSLRTAEVRSIKDAAAQAAEACRETEAVRVVVGLPVNMNGTRGPMAERAQLFANTVGVQTGLPVDLWDERLSSGLVERVMLEADLSRRRRKDARDKLAAQVILQGYLDAQQTRAGEGGGGGAGEQDDAADA